jgi:hypothetical protein
MAATEVNSAAAQDSVLSLMALGIIAYTTETMVHELIGHGGVCLASGGSVTMLTPLWMNCSLQTTAMVAAGPLANLVAALLFWTCLRAAEITSDGLRFFLWLSLAFNSLVFAGYLMVGGTFAFGDWSYLFSGIQPAWIWRLSAVAAGAILYYAFLGLVGSAYARIGGTRDRLFRRTLIPAIGAALVAVAAQLVGQGLQPGGLVLPLACTLIVGASLLATRQWIANAASHQPNLRVGPNTAYAAAALVIAAVYIAVIGPGVRFSA